YYWVVAFFYVLSLVFIVVSLCLLLDLISFFFFQAEDGIRDATVTGVQTCALPISRRFQFRARGCNGSRVVGAFSDAGSFGHRLPGCDRRFRRQLHRVGRALAAEGPRPK